MKSAKAMPALHNWSGPGRWTLAGTAACVIISIVFNAVFFGDLGPDAVHRSLVSATILPLVLVTPVLLYMSLRLRGLGEVNRRLRLVAGADSLTGCLNRGAFTGKVDQMLQQLDPRSTGALLMIDADHFKSINDVFGHEVGDEALTMIAQSIRSALRPGDLVGRMGGEEFAVYLPEVDQPGATAIAERIRAAVSLVEFAPDGQPRPLSVSIGGAVFEGPASYSHLFRTADQRLYGVKKTGRNRTAVVHLEDHPAVALQRSA
ncbi:MAG: hypothetical protein JWP99_842 [Devosia sp.]|nr:hypothetical protein [Devosia sp.]